MSQKIFPIILMVLMLGASVVYGLSGDARRCLYWLFGAAISATVTF
jgi:hypothetical protein